MLAGLAVGSLAFISNAAAGDDKVFSGNSCVPDPGTLGTPFLYFNSIGNDSTTNSLTVHCPFVKDSTSIQQGVMYAFDRNTAAGADVSCTITYGGWHVGSATFAATTQTATTVGTDTGMQQIAFGALLTPGFGGSYFASCTIPPKTAAGASHIAYFQLVETP